MRFKIIFAALLLSTAAFADPVITSITPNTAPVAGGTTVIIRGTGFSDMCIICSPPFGATPEIKFLETPAQSVKFLDSTRLEVVTPAHFPMTVPVTIRQFDGSQPFTLENAFTFFGDPNTGFDPILFPIFMGPVRGAFDSEFHTTAWMFNEHRTEAAAVYGIDTSCYLFSPVRYPEYPYLVQPGAPEERLLLECNQSPGRLLWVPKGKDTLALNLRVRDLTRESSSHGVEIPVLRRDDFRERITLLGVPIEPRFRNTLRIYSLARGEVFVNLQVGNESREVTLPAAEDWFHPAVLTFTDFPLPSAGAPTGIKVIIDSPGVPVWAFITVTNNDTQQITTINPN